MPETLEALLKTPPLATAEQIMIQAGKAAVFMNAQGSPEPVGAVMAQAEVEALIMPAIPANVKAAMATQPVVALQANLAGVGNFEIRVAREATGMRAILKRLPAGGVA